MKQIKRNRKAGFTLLELLAVLVIMCLMTGLAINSYIHFARGAGMRTSTWNVQATLAFARQEAITRRTRTRFIFGTNTEGEGWYVVVTNDPMGVAFGDIIETNYLAKGVVWGQTGVVEFNINGSCNLAVGNWTGMQMPVNIYERDRVGNSLSSTTVVYGLTGRAKVLED